MHDRKILLRYLVEMFGAFFFYALVLVASIDVGRPMHHGIGRTLLLISPMVPVLLMIGVIVRYFRRLDEYLQRLTLENIAIAAAVTAGWTFTYGFLENAGFPHLSMFNVLPVICFVWVGVVLVRWMANR